MLLMKTQGTASETQPENVENPREIILLLPANLIKI